MRKAINKSSLKKNYIHEPCVPVLSYYLVHWCISGRSFVSGMVYVSRVTVKTDFLPRFSSINEALKRKLSMGGFVLDGCMCRARRGGVCNRQHSPGM